LVVAPARIGSADFFGQHHFSTKGSGVELAYGYGGTSGRWAVAEAIARYFPKHGNFIEQNFKGLEVGRLPSGPYPHDTFSRRTDTLVRYTTPPLTKGAGTVWVLAPAAQSVQGLTMLVRNPDGPDLLRVNIRLPEADRRLAEIVLENAEREGRQAR
jgi:hypothetical protein